MQPSYIPPYANNSPTNYSPHGYSPQNVNFYAPQNFSPNNYSPPHQQANTGFMNPTPVPWSPESPANNRGYQQAYGHQMSLRNIQRADSEEILNENSISFHKTDF